MESSKTFSRKSWFFRFTAKYMGEIVMFNYPVLECLVAFAIVFSIGYLVGARNGRQDTVGPNNEVARI